VGDDDDSADAAPGECGGDAGVFADFVLEWATAMAISGRTIGIGGPQLVQDTVITNYQSASFVEVQDPQNPTPGELFGANGFQQGFNVRDVNTTFTGGTDPNPTALTALDVRTGNLDNLLFHPQSDFFGVVAGHYGVVTVLVSGIEQEENYLLIETANGEPLIGSVIRLNDASPHFPRLTLEDVDGAKITTVRDLGSLEYFDERNVIGRIDATELITPSASVEPPDLEGDDDDAGDDDDVGADDDDSAEEEDSSDIEVTDTDRFQFQLGGQQLVGIWVDRRTSSLAGEAALSDPFIAVMPFDDVPDAFDYSQWGFGPATGPCYDAALYNYPVVMPTWIAAQGNLISDPVSADEASFDATGSRPGAHGLTYGCLYDHDQDGVADVDETIPENLLEQILLRQGERLAVDPDAFLNTFDDLVLPAIALDVTVPWYSADYIDFDSNESPDDEFVTNVKQHNIGGRQVAEGEEAVWFGYLPAGDYIIIVGDASGGAGAYDLSLRTLVTP
jgi:hypothetical protein